MLLGPRPATSRTTQTYCIPPICCEEKPPADDHRSAAAFLVTPSESDDSYDSTMLRDFDPIGFVHTTDTTRARSFYVDVLGLEFVEETPFALVLKAGPIMIRVTPVEGHVPLVHTVLGWSVPDIALVMRSLIGRGVEPRRFHGLDQDETGVWCSPGGAQVAWFADPDGNTLSLTQF